MKKILLFLCAVFMAAPTAARAETCPDGQYWNSIDKKCDSCQRAVPGAWGNDNREQCLACKEAFDGQYTSLTADLNKSKNKKSYPLCTKVKSDAYYVEGDGSIRSCGSGGNSCATPHCTSEVTYNAQSGWYHHYTTCKDGCGGNWYAYYLYGTCLPTGGEYGCSKNNGGGKDGGKYSHGTISYGERKSVKGYYCLKCSDGYTLKTEKNWFGGIDTTCLVSCKTENCVSCDGNGKYCRKCSDGYFLLRESGREECVKNCPSGYTQQGNWCIKITCSANCTACSSATTCTTCAAGYSLIGGKCVAGTVAQCPSDSSMSSDGCCCIPK